MTTITNYIDAKKALNIRIVLFISVVLVSIYSLFIFSVSVYFETNDDLLMMLLASGNYTGNIEENLVFINPLLGKLLGFLYTLNHTFPWYIIILMFFNYISTLILVLCVYKKDNPQKHNFLIIIAIISLSLIVLQKVNFTTTAALLGTAATVLILSRCRRFEILGGLSLLFLSAALRYEVGILIFSLSFFFFLYKFSFFKTFYLASCIVSMFVFLKLYEINSYSGEWKEFYSINKTRGRVNDNPNLWMVDNQNEIIIGKEKYWLIKSFFFDPSTMVESDFARIISVLKKEGKVVDYRLIKYFDINTLLTIIYIVLVYFYLISINRERNIRVLLVLVLVVFIILLSYIQMSAILKWRVLYTAVLPIIIIPFVVFHRVRIVDFFFIFIPILIYSSVSILNFSITRDELSTQSKAVYDQFIKDSDPKIVPFHSSWAIETIPFFELCNLNWTNYVASGWMSHIPNNKYSSFDQIADEMYIIAQPSNLNSINLFLNYTNNCYGRDYSIHIRDSLCLNLQPSHYLIQFD